MTITLQQFWMGRDKTHAKELTDEIKKNAVVTVERVNKLLAYFAEHSSATAVRGVNSGWRPPTVNAGVRNAAPKSRHMTGQAVDISDDDGKLDEFCMSVRGQEMLAELGLWLEHPSATPRWCHLQTVPPRSGNRVFKP